jgi:hypothetical protein
MRRFLATSATQREVALILVSQAFSSGGNFLAALVAARVSDPSEFGAVALTLAFYAVASQLVRPFAGSVMQIRVIHLGKAEQRLARGLLVVALGASLLVTCAFLPIAWHLLAGPYRQTLLAVVLLVPLLVVYDSLRLWAISVRRPARALVMDSTWLALQILGFECLHLAGIRSGASVIAVWAIGGACVATAAWIGCSVACSGHAAFRVARTASWKLGRVYAFDAVLTAASNTGFILLLSSEIAVGAIGQLRALELPFGLLVTASQGASLFLQPTTRRLCVAGNVRRAWRVVLLGGVALVVASAAISAVVLIEPADTLRRIFGPSFRPHIGIVIAILIKYASFGPLLVMTTMTRSLGVRRVTLPFTIGFTIVATVLALGAASVSLTDAYIVLYVTLSLGSLEVVRRIRGTQYSAETV